MVDPYSNALQRVLDYAKSNNFVGYNKYDALDSPLLRALSFNNKWIRLVYSQVVMRSPINIRPLLGVPKTINPKGFGLLTATYAKKYLVTKDEADLIQARYFADWLIENPSPIYPTRAWGYQHPWQDVGFFAPANLPNRVVTYFVCRGLLDLFDVTQDERYLNAVEEAMEFLLDAPNVIYEDDSMKCLSYVPDTSVDWVVMDVSILTATMATRLNTYRPKDKYVDEATKLVRYVVDKQTDYGAWWYSHPPKAHSKMHDNYHTGYICDGILDYTEHTGNEEFMAAYHTGIEYYRDYLFLKDGTPKWMNNAVYPLDVHGSAQGILSFIKASKFDDSYYDFAKIIADWAIQHMQHLKKGYFYYQKNRYFKTPFTLMRWSNGWMARALSELVYEESKRKAS